MRDCRQVPGGRHRRVTWIGATILVGLLFTGDLGCAPQLSDPGQVTPSSAPDAAAAIEAGSNPALDAAFDTEGAADEPPVATPPDGAIDSMAEDDGAGADGGADSRGLTADDLVGVWEGTTSQQLPITFDVNGIGVDQWEFGWQLPACASATVTTFAAPVPIVDGQVMHTVPAAAGGMTVVMTIVFVSATEAQGSIDFTLHAIPNVPSCSGHAAATFDAHLRP